MQGPNPDVLKHFKTSRIIWPVLIGVGIVGLLLYRDLRAEGPALREAFVNIDWTGQTFLWLGVGILMMVLRDFGYMWRMRVVTERKMSWRSCFEVTLLWEFASAASPSIVGGAAVAVFLFIKEKFTAGKATSIVFITIFIDELYYLLILPVVLFLVPYDTIFAPLLEMDQSVSSFFGTSIVTAFWIAYTVIFGYIVLLAVGLFIAPLFVSRLIKRLFMTRLFRRWRRRGFHTADEMLLSSKEFGKKPIKFWLEAGAATAMAWTSRYLVLNCILAAFVSGGFAFTQHVVAFARQAVLFVLMIVSPTPGSSGVAELGFQQLFSSLVVPTALTLTLALIWRLISYYPYLFIGLPILPRWVRRVYKTPPAKISAPNPSKPTNTPVSTSTTKTQRS